MEGLLRSSGRFSTTASAAFCRSAPLGICLAPLSDACVRSSLLRRSQTLCVVAAMRRQWRLNGRQRVLGARPTEECRRSLTTAAAGLAAQPLKRPGLWQGRHFSTSLCVHRPTLLPHLSVLATSSPQQLQRRWTGSSFISQVMNQVKKELETNEALKQSMKEFKESGVATTSGSLKRHMEEALKRLVDTSNAVREKTSHATAFCQQRLKEAQQHLAELRSTSPLVSASLDQGAKALLLTKRAAIAVIDTISSVVETLKDEKAEAAKQRAENWRQEMQRQKSTDTSSGTPTGAAE